MNIEEKCGMKKPVSLVLVGVGGMGRSYLQALFNEFSPEDVRISAIIEPNLRNSGVSNELEKRSIPLFAHLHPFYESGRSADLVVICSPIHHHVPQACEALENGSYVLCEKPIGATIQEAQHLIGTRDVASRWVMIGYQWSYSKAIQALKKDVISGRFGKPIRLKTLCLWPRHEAYYQRNDWAGRIKVQGKWVLDSPANNAMAHFLHNLFYILGERTDRCAMPLDVEAELYRVYPIENYDTVACRAHTKEGCELLYYASHAVSPTRGPMFVFAFEEATVSYGETINMIVAQDRKGNQSLYGDPESEHPLRKLFEAVAAVRDPNLILCGPEAALAQTLCMNGMQESAPEIITLPESLICRDPDEKRWFGKGLDQELYDCYVKGILPSEAKLSWAWAGKRINLDNYRHFPGGELPSVQTAVDEEME
jgi:predicted dehydrogenase